MTDLQIDYRSVYAALLQDFLGAGNNALNVALVYNFSNSKPAIIKEAAKADPGCYTDIVLPVTLTDLKAMLLTDGNIAITWVTQQEQQSHHFDVEKYIPGSGYTVIGTVSAAGFSSLPKSYRLLDTHANVGVNQYRLRQADTDQRHQYFGPVVVKVNAKNTQATISVGPNPARGSFQIRIQSGSNSRGKIMVYDLLGHHLLENNIIVAKGNNSFTIDCSRLPKANIVVSIQLENGTRHSQQVVCL